MLLKATESKGSITSHIKLIPSIISNEQYRNNMQ